jgi:ATP-dependent Lon protease
MELITMPGYITPEKTQIAKHFLVPRQLEQNGLSNKHLRFAPGSIETIIDEYTMEAGVRSLEREIASVCRKTAREFAKDENHEKIVLKKDNIETFLGPKKIFKDNLPAEDEIGIVVGLAYTQSGGDVLPVEVNLMPGKGNYKTTGLHDFGIEPVQFMNHDIHIHFPAAAIPKDGPSAGVTITSALLSCLTGRKARHTVAMTGEISLRGRVLPIGGVREKVTAAKRMKIKKVILPLANRSDLEKVPEMVKKGISFVFVDNYTDIVDLILVKN